MLYNPDGHFLADIAIFPLAPDTRRTHAFNGIRRSFSYANDALEGGVEHEQFDVWPEFLDDGGNEIQTDVPLMGTLKARMHIIRPNMVQVHVQRLRVGTQFFCMEGPRKVAAGVVTSLAPN